MESTKRGTMKGYNQDKITRLSVKSKMGSMSGGGKNKITSLSAKKSGMVMVKNKGGKPNFTR